jgi:5,5'-dehydrodivanillate O-demethylase oxygenase subunit
MGELLRRYWYPVAFTADLDTFPVKKVRLLGEDLALWKTPEGGYGVVQEKCPHRHASMAYGVVEPGGLRCGYHGWKFATEGSCADQPAEPDESTFKDRIKAFAGEAQELGGMIFVYLGPGRRPSSRGTTRS